MSNLTLTIDADHIFGEKHRFAFKSACLTSPIAVTDK